MWVFFISFFHCQTGGSEHHGMPPRNSMPPHLHHHVLSWGKVKQNRGSWLFRGVAHPSSPRGVSWNRPGEE